MKKTHKPELLALDMSVWKNHLSLIIIAKVLPFKGLVTNRIYAQMKLGLMSVLMRQNGRWQTKQTPSFYKMYSLNGLNGDKCVRGYFLSEVALLLLFSHLKFYVWGSLEMQLMCTCKWQTSMKFGLSVGHRAS